MSLVTSNIRANVRHSLVTDLTNANLSPPQTVAEVRETSIYVLLIILMVALIHESCHADMPNSLVLSHVMLNHIIIYRITLHYVILCQYIFGYVITNYVVF